MITVRNILQSKGSEVWTVSPSTSVFEALGIMAKHDVGALLVMEADEVIGVFSERDYARKVILRGKSSREITVSQIMSLDVVSVTLHHSIEECMELMTGHRIRHLPVLDEQNLVGVVSIGDVVKAMISDREYTIKLLENFITGTR